MVRAPLWETRWRQLCEYKDFNGHCNVPQHYQKNEKLASFVRSMRSEYKKYQRGESSRLTKGQIKQLNNLGFQWELREALGKSGMTTRWQTRLEELIEYKRINGNCNVPFGWKGNPQLAIWVHNQRSHYSRLQRGKGSPMTAGRIAALNKIGFEWKGIRGGSRRSKASAIRVLQDGGDKREQNHIEKEGLNSSATETTTRNPSKRPRHQKNDTASLDKQPLAKDNERVHRKIQ